MERGKTTDRERERERENTVPGCVRLQLQLAIARGNISNRWTGVRRWFIDLFRCISNRFHLGAKLNALKPVARVIFHSVTFVSFSVASNEETRRLSFVVRSAQEMTKSIEDFGRGKSEISKDSEV